MLTIELPDEIEARLDALAKATGRSKTSCALDILLEHLEDFDDLLIAKKRLADIEAGHATPVPLAEVMRKHGMAD